MSKTAKEIWAIMKAAQDYNYTINTIDKQIEATAAKGQSSLSFFIANEVLRDRLLQYYHNLGFKVSTSSNCAENLIIDWLIPESEEEEYGFF